MTKAKVTKWGLDELVVHLMTEHGLRNEVARAIAKGMMRKVRDVLLDGKPVLLSNIGTLKPVTVPARRSSLFGRKVDLPQRYRVKFNVSKELVRERAKRNSGPRNLV